MKIIHDINKCENYINTYKLDDLFSKNMRHHMVLLEFEKEEHLCKTGGKMEYLLFLVQGRVKVYTLVQNGKSLLLCFNKPFRVVGDIEFIRNTVFDTNVQAIETVYCIGIKIDKIREHAFEDAKFLRYMCIGLGEKLSRVSIFSSINLLYPLENRLASYLLAVGEPNRDFKALDKGCNLVQIAELLGTSYRHLLRTLNTLKEKGAIEKRGGSYMIKNREILESLSGDVYE